MSKYTTNVSDISKGKVLRSWFRGGLGILGFHFFSVGRVKHGFVRLLVGLLLVGATVSIATQPDIPAFPKLFMVLVTLMPGLIDYYKIKMGKFRDNVGGLVREP